MKKYILLSCFALLALTQINAQAKQKNNKIDRLEHRKEIIKNLNLTHEQQAQVKTINTNFKQKVKELKASNSMTLGEYKQKIGDLNQQRKAAFDATLTATQKAKLESEKLQKQQERKEKMATRFEKMKNKLQLTQDQEAKLKTKRAEVQQQVAIIRNDNALSQEQKREELKALRVSQKEYLKTILTQEQLKKLEQKTESKK
jgi:hypothetical protein